MFQKWILQKSWLADIQYLLVCDSQIFIYDEKTV